MCSCIIYIVSIAAGNKCTKMHAIYIIKHKCGCMSSNIYDFFPFTLINNTKLIARIELSLLKNLQIN